MRFHVLIKIGTRALFKPTNSENSEKKFSKKGNAAR